jgi:hypothetical protein
MVLDALKRRRERAYVIGAIEAARRGATPRVVLESPRAPR